MQTFEIVLHNDLTSKYSPTSICLDTYSQYSVSVESSIVNSMVAYLTFANTTDGIYTKMLGASMDIRDPDSYIFNIEAMLARYMKVNIENYSKDIPIKVVFVGKR